MAMDGGRRLAPLLLLLFVLSQLQPEADALVGSGGQNVAGLITSWGSSYQFSQDDVKVTFAPSTAYQAALAYLMGQVDFPFTEDALPVEQLVPYNGTQFPMLASGLALIYNLPNTTLDLVLNRTVLAAIWVGNITMWDDVAIQELNPDMVAAGELPNKNITLAFDTFGVLDLTAVLTSALCRFSADYCAEFINAITLIENMEVTQRGMAIPFNHSQDRLFFVQETPYSMTYSGFKEAMDSGLHQVLMYNKAGQLVSLNLDSVRSAMVDQDNSTTYSIALSDAPGENSWPLSHFEFLTLANNSTGAFDCGDVQDLLAFLSWAQFNDKASEVAQNEGYVPLSNHFRKRVFDSLYNITCHGKRAFNTAVLLGGGGSSPTYPKWASAFESSTFLLKYFASTDAQALTDSLELNVDFGATSSYKPGDDLTDPDLGVLPVVAYAIAPAYNVPALSGLTPTLVFDLQTVSDILYGRITKWNHGNISALNPGVALPNADIRVVVTTDAALENLLMTNALANRVPDWTLGADLQVMYPVVGDPLTLDLAPSYVASTAASTDNTFTFWNYYELYQTRTIKIGRMINAAGSPVAADSQSVVSAVDDYVQGRVLAQSPGAVLGEGAGSWPVTAVGNFLVHIDDTVDCNKARALTEWLYWSQTSTAASDIATRTGATVAAQSPLMYKRMLTFIASLTCDGLFTSSIHGCVWEGTLCANEGQCVDGRCNCNSGRAGEFCESESSTSDALIIGLTVGLVVPVIVFCALLLFCLLLAFALYVRRNRRQKDEWEIDVNELEFGEQLGQGGNGQVHKGLWKGTEVAIKMMTADQVTRDMERNFKEEVRVMTALRHPNVVLFMAACTKPPKMCIVMEFMALGSLYDFLHNELVPAVPFGLVLKLAYQAAKGMHFLHSSGIVHRDLKSLNLLLDNKWNIKVSDFGLTKFNEEVKRSGKGGNVQGSVHWTAPEILNESVDVDFILADVYSFGIILWELLTRLQPYGGMSPAAIAVSVIRDNLRPPLPEEGEKEADGASHEYRELLTNCWHQDPTVRPTFLEVMTRLSTMSGESAFTSKSSSSSKMGVSHLSNGSWSSVPHFSSSIHTSESSSNSSNGGKAAGAAAAGVVPPDGEVTILFSDITRAASLWEFNAAAMKEATLLHNQLLRSLLKEHQGYEVVFIRDKNSGEGSFCMAFQRTSDALQWCMAVQQELLKAEWPEALLDHPGAAEEWGDVDDRVIFRGLRVRMGIHVGRPRMVRDAMSRRIEYIGPVVNAAARITSVAHGGQILLSQAAYEKVKDSSAELAREKNRFACLGRFEMPDAVDARRAKVWEMRVAGLEGRFFNGVARKTGGADADDSVDSEGNHNSSRNEDDEDGDDGDDGAEMEENVGEQGMMFKEDNFLTSANLCRWVIDFKEIQLGRQVGLGSYGVVFKGRWKGVDVAVKKFVKQKLDERRMLEFRAEMAFLSELHHPNIVLFIGACVKRPNLCIVTEFVKQGSLNDLLMDSSVRLPWNQRMRMLRSAALGVNYLHSLSPCIVHRDLKPSNLLVDENWNVKVADFGFARIKEENATMTRCGTPSWTAPEIIRGEKYSEKADVYSFGMTMWQMATRKQPFAGRNFMGVSLDVLEGKRPQLPADCPLAFGKTVKRCWHAKPDKRPSMDEVLIVLNQLTGDHSLEDHDGDSSIVLP